MKRRNKGLAVGLALFLVLMLAVAGCTRGTEPNTSGSTTSPEQYSGGGKLSARGVAPGAEPDRMQPSPADEGSGADKGRAGRMIVRQKNLEIEVKSVRAAYGKIDTVSQSLGGYIASSSIRPKDEGYPQPVTSTSEGGPSTTEPQYFPTPRENNQTGPLAGTIVVKVPVANLREAVTALKKLGRLQAEHDSTQEITEEFVDVSSRLRNLKAEEARYLDFFDAAKNVGDMLRIEEQLARVRGDIEQLQGRADYLKKSASLATVTVFAYEGSAVVRPAGRDWGFGEAFTRSVQYFVGVLNLMVVLFGALLPFVLVAAAFAGLVKLWWRRRTRGKSAAA